MEGVALKMLFLKLHVIGLEYVTYVAVIFRFFAAPLSVPHVSTTSLQVIGLT